MVASWLLLGRFWAAAGLLLGCVWTVAGLRLGFRFSWLLPAMCFQGSSRPSAASPGLLLGSSWAAIALLAPSWLVLSSSWAPPGYSSLLLGPDSSGCFWLLLSLTPLVPCEPDFFPHQEIRVSLSRWLPSSPLLAPSSPASQNFPVTKQSHENKRVRDGGGGGGRKTL